MPREIRQDRYADWRAEAEAIRVDPARRRPFAAARFAFGQVPFAMHLLNAQRRLDRARDPDYVSWGQVVLLVLSLPGIPLPTIPFTLVWGVACAELGNLHEGLALIGLATWQAAGAWYIVRGAKSRGIPIVLGSEARRKAVRRLR
ncbi:hypothetical protein ACU639_05235 [Streptomyces cynarae]|uniref:hypothetical protein n=1 Tax=Streptomyces cynarae TaxID=2981134 RepID=UPI00406CB0E1